MITRLDTNQKGCYTEYLFALKCMELGYNVAKPMLDASRYDLIVDNVKELVDSKLKKLFPQKQILCNVQNNKIFCEIK